MSFTTAAWVAKQEVDFIDWMVPDTSGMDLEQKYLATQWAGIVSAPFLAFLSLSPYYQGYTMHQGAKWAVRDIALHRAGGKFAIGRSVHTMHPGWLKFATKRGALKFERMALTKAVGSRFIPYAGWALLAYDLYSAGKYLNEEYDFVESIMA